MKFVAVAALLAVNMLAAMLLVHLPAGFFLTGEGPDGIEFVFSLFAACITLALAGAGAYALDARREESMVDRRAAVA